MSDSSHDDTNRDSWVAFDGEAFFDPPPRWMPAMFSIGRILAEQHDRERPWLAVLSTPVQSSAAGMIALAAQTQTNAPIGEEVSYFEFLRQLPRGTPVRHRPGRQWRNGFRLIFHDFGGPEPHLCGATENPFQRIAITPSTSEKWEPVNQDLRSQFKHVNQPDASAQALMRAAIGLCPEDMARLRRESSPVVFVGPTGGTPEFHKIYNDRISLGLRGGDGRRSLAAMLGFRNSPSTPDGCAWGGTYINPLSRSAFQQCEQLAESTEIAVFDGIHPFRRFGDYFHKSTRVVVMSRAVANDVVFDLCRKLEQLRQDGALYHEMPRDMPSLPSLLLFDSARTPRS